MKKKVILVLSFFSLILVISYSLLVFYNTQNLNTGFEEKAQVEFDELYYMNETETKNFSLKQIKQLDEAGSWIALFEASDGSGMYAHYELDWFKRFHINAIGSVPAFTYLDIPTNNGIYGVMVGTNDSLRLAKVNLQTQGAAQLEFNFSTADEKYVIKYEKLPKDINSSEPATFTFYDTENKVIEQ